MASTSHLTKAAEYGVKLLCCALFAAIVYYWPHDWIRTVGLWAAGAFSFGWLVLIFVALGSGNGKGH